MTVDPSQNTPGAQGQKNPVEQIRNILTTAQNQVPPEPQNTNVNIEKDKKCPQCGGTMVFDPASGKLSCPYCGHMEEIPVQENQQADPQYEGSAAELDFDSAEHTDNCDWGLEKITMKCKSCGAESVYDAAHVADVCPYCGSTQIMRQDGQETLTPGGVVPFQISLKEAVQRFGEWIKRRFFAPRAVKSVKPASFTGIYLPYWTFDTDTTSQYTAQYGIDHTTEDSKGNTRTYTDWHGTSGEYSEFIDDAAICASNTHEPSLLGRIQPFNTKDNKVYDPKYIAGYAAERYSIGLKSAWASIQSTIRSHISDQISSLVLRQYNADHVNITSLTTQYANIKYKYLLMPVWISSFKFRDKVYQFMVNGQTGRVGGKTPISVWKVLLVVGIIAAIAIGIGYLMYPYYAY